MNLFEKLEAKRRQKELEAVDRVGGTVGADPAVKPMSLAGFAKKPLLPGGITAPTEHHAQSPSESPRVQSATEKQVQYPSDRHNVETEKVKTSAPVKAGGFRPIMKGRVAPNAPVVKEPFEQETTVQEETTIELSSDDWAHPEFHTTFDAPEEQATAPVETPKKIGLSLPKGSLLAGLADRAKGVAVTSNVTAAAATCVDAGESYSPEQFFEEWNELDDEIRRHPDGAEIDAAEMQVFTERRADLLRKVCARIEEIFVTELNHLSVEKASDFAIKELSQMIKLTFMRVQDAPAAYAMLVKKDRAKLIKGMRAMAAKRNAAVKSRPPQAAKALSNSLENMTATLPDGMLDDAADAGFDMTSMFGM